MKFKKNDLLSMLNRTKREQFISGKAQSQVMACVLRADGDSTCTTTSLVRDGKTSLSNFECGLLGGLADEQIPIPDIDTALGVLSMHGQTVSIKHEGDNLVFRSGNKRTILKTSGSAMAFPHSTETIDAWQQKSLELSKKFIWQRDGNDVIDWFAGYEMANGTVREPFVSWVVSANELFEALRCDNMNGQKFNRYQIAFDSKTKTFRVGVGTEIKGFTIVDFPCENDDFLTVRVDDADFDWNFNGGLENVLKGLGGNVVVHFLDFRKENQGIRMVIEMANAGWIYQAGVLA